MKISIIILVILIIAILGLIIILLGLCRRIKKKAADVCEAFLGSRDVIRSVRKLREDVDTTEKSLSSATRLYLPKIQEDFPLFNWEQYKLKVRRAVEEYIRTDLGGGSIEFHRTEISNYVKKSGTCAIDAMSSAGYMVNGKKKEERFVTKLVYIQDITKIMPGTRGLGLNCPNCGAPITNLGNKCCEYCGTGVKEINEKVWRVADTVIG